MLADSVAGFLASGMTSGGSAVIIAADDHREVFMTALALRGFDPDTLCAESRLIVHDADGLLSRCMVDSWLGVRARVRTA